MKTYYTTPPMKLGSHEWRCSVTDYEGALRCTNYEFRRLGADAWQRSRNWPGYERNHNNAHGGLPASLSRLWNRYELEIVAALNGGEVAESRTLFA